MIIATQGVRLFAGCFKRSEVIHSLLYMELSYMLSVIQGLKLFAHCYTWRLFAHIYTWSEALCSMLYTRGKFHAHCYTREKVHAHCYTWIEASCSLLYMN